MNFYFALLRREISENRGILVILPSAFAALACVALIGLVIFSTSPFGKALFEKGVVAIEDGSHEISIEVDDEKEDLEFSVSSGTESHDMLVEKYSDGEGTSTNIRVFPFEIEVADSVELEKLYDEDLKEFAAGIDGIAVAFIVIMMLASVIYILGSLHTDRKDKSILFWKSLPITETQTVLSKLVTVAVATPTIAIACGFVVCLFWMIAGTIFMKINYDNIPIWEIISSAGIFSSVFTTWLKSLVAYLWLLPLIGWLFLCSAAAKRSPSVIAIIVPIALMIVETLIFRSDVVATILFSGVSLASQYFSADLGLGGILGFLAEARFWMGLIIGSAFIYAAIWLRNHRFEI